jgi:hypothetical protein
MMWNSKKSYQIKISNRFAALEKLYDDVVVNRAWKIIGI